MKTVEATFQTKLSIRQRASDKEGQMHVNWQVSCGYYTTKCIPNIAYGNDIISRITIAAYYLQYTYQSVPHRCIWTHRKSTNTKLIIVLGYIPGKVMGRKLGLPSRFSSP